MISIYDIKIDGTFSAGTGTTTGLILFDAGANGRLNISTDNILEGSTNIFYTNARSIGSTLTAYALNSSGVITASDSILSAFGKVQYQINNKENTIVAGTISQYYRGDKVWATLDKTAVGLSNVDNTSDLSKPISTATQLALNNKVNTSLLGANSGVATLDSSGKVPTSQLPTSVIGAMIYQGSWNATTNTPTLVSSTGTKGFYYIVSVAGSTLIDGVNEWKVGDWIVFDGTNWDKIDNTDAISSFNGRTGAITLTSSDVTTALTYTPYNSTNPSNYITSAQAPVQTVFGRSGTVVATSGDYNTSLVTENTNLYFTQARAISSVINTYALGTNTSLSVSDTIVGAFGKVQAQLNNKQNSITTGTIAQYFRGDLSLGTLDTLAVPENTNLYFTTSRVLNTTLTGYSIGTNTSISSTDSVLVAFGKVQAQVNNKENSVVAGTTLQYYRGDKTFQTLDTLAVPENTNLYFTNARSIASVLTGFTSTTGTVTSTDTVLSSIQKIYGNSLLKPTLIGTAPISYNSSTGTISIAQSSSSVDGYITATDYNRIYNSWQIGGNTIPATRFLGSTSAFDVQLGTNNVVIATLKNGTNLLDISTGIVVNNLTANKLVFSDGNKQLTSTGIGTSAQFLKADGSIDSTSYLALSGGTLTGNLILNADPTLALGAATKQYVDNLITGLSWKNSVDYATTTNITTLSGLITVDGFTVSSGDRILVKDQTTQTLNGIYIASVSAWTRSEDANTANEILGATVYVEKGTVNATTQWCNNNTTITLGSTNISFVKIAGSGTYTNGNGLLLSSNVFSIDATKVPYYTSLSTGFVRYNGSAWVFDTNTYLTGNQTITLSGDISGSGTTSIVTSIGAGKVTNAMLVNSSLTIGSTSVSLGSTASTIAGLTLTSPTINGGTHTGITNLGIRSTGTGVFDISLINTENLTAGRNLTLVLNNADRTLNLGGNLITTGNNITLNTSGVTSVTLPTSGTLATLAGTETLTNKTIGSSNTIGAVTVTVGSDATGDIYYRNASGVLTRLGIGTTGQFLGINTGLPAWTTPGYISSLNGLTASTQTFVNDTNISIVSNTNTHTVTWVGTLADSRITSAGTWNAKQSALNGTGFVRMSGTTINYISGTTSQFVKADGSLDSNTYALSSALSNYVDLSNNQSVNGVKSFVSALNLSITDNILLTQNTNRIITSLPTYRSSYFGNLAGNSSGAGTDNTGVGHNSLTAITTGTNNTALGSNVLSATNIGNSNIGIGANSLTLLTSGSRNIGIGTDTLKAVLTNTDNIAIGFSSLISTTANNNTAVGSYAGFSNISGAGNVFIGYQAGYSETTSNKLYISNSNTSNPLIYGDFSTKSLTFNGDISITNSADTTKKLSIDTGTNTTSGVTTTLSIQSSGNRTVSLPIGNSNDTILLSSATQSMSNKTIGSSNILGNVTMTMGSDATGDIYYRNVSGILTRLAVGSSNQVLTVLSGLPSWTTPSTGLTSLNGLTTSTQTFTNDTNISIVSATNTHTITWNGTLADNRITSATNWNTAFNNRITSLTTTGSSGASTLSANVLNIPNYTLSGLGGQPLNANLTSLSGLTYASLGFVKMSATGTFTLDTNTYLTSNQTITLSGDITGSGTTAITTTIGANKVTNTMLAGSIASSKLVGTDISTVGTITSGTWNATAITDTYISSASTWNAKQNALSGTGFVKISGTTISYDNTSYLPLSGGTLTGNLILNADPTLALGAATKQYVDNLITGLTWKNAVDYATTTNITLSGLITVDGFTVSSGDRILVKDQTTQTTNGIYVVSASAWTRADDSDIASEILGTTVYVEKGTVNATTQWCNNNTTITLGTTNITFVKIAGSGTYTNGSGLTLTGNVFSISNLGVTNAMLAGSIASSKLVGTDISTVGTITTGAWNGTAIGDTYISSSSNWNTAYTNRITSVSTTGSSGASTLSANVLNIPNYTLSGLGGQPLNTNLTSLSGLSFVSTSFVKMTASGTFTLDTNTYLTSNQTITLSGDISGSGTTAITTTIGANKVTNTMLAGSIASSKLVGTDIVTLGTITTGTWNGTAISDTYITSAGTWNAKQNALNGTGFVRMSGTTINYISGTTSQFVKADGSLDSNTYVDTTNTQTVGGAKTFSANTTIGSNIILSQSTDSTSTGTNARLGVRTSPYINLTNASLTSIGSVNITGATAGTTIYYTNLTGNTITIINNYGSAIAGEKIFTGVNANVTLPNNSIFVLSYNSTLSAWICNNTTSSFNIQDTQISSASNWNTAYSNRITSLSTTGSSGSATLISNVLNIPTYTLSGLGGIGGSGTANQIAYFSNSNTLTSNTNLYYNPSTGFGLGTNSPSVLFEIAGTSATSDAFFTRYETSSNGYNIVGRKARGTAGTPTAINNDDTIVCFGGRAYGTSAWSSSNRVEMSFYSSQTWTNTAQGTYISWYVTPNNTTVMTQAMTLTNTGLTAPSFIKSGGTSAEFLKADGSVDSDEYALNSALSGYVTLSSAQTISGIKTFSSDIIVSGMKVGRTAGTGGNMTIFGLNALSSNTSGSGNTAIGQSALLANTSGNNNTVIGLNNLYNNTTGSTNVSIGAGVLGSNITGGSIVAVGNAIDVTSDGLNNVIGIGYGASLTTSNTIVMGNNSITNMKTAGTLTLGAITLPNTDGTSGQVLSTNGSGSVSWTTVSSGSTYTAGNGLTLTGSSFSINTAITADLSSAQSLTNKKLGSLTTNGFVKTSSGDGTLFVDTTNYLPLTGGTVTGNLSLSNNATTEQPTLLGFFNNVNDNINVRYTKTAISVIPIDTWQFRIGGTTARRLAFTHFDTFEFLNMSGTTASNAVVNIPSTTTSTTTTSGALVVGGGIGAGGSIYALSFVRNGGTSSQFLKADGSVDSNTYALNSALSNYVDLTNNQTINGSKTFVSDISANGVSLGKGLNASLSENVAVGFQTLGSTTTGNSNTGMGYASLYQTTTGTFNSAFGAYAIYESALGVYNTGIGAVTLRYIGNASYNTALGAYAGTGGTSSVVGNNNTFLGAYTEGNTGITNSTAVGAYANVTSSNTIQLGNSSITSVRTTGTLTLNAVTYPNSIGGVGQALIVPPSGNVLTWSTVTTPTSTDTLTNKRITPRVGTIVSSSTLSIDTNLYDYYSITALTVNITSVVLTGTPTNGQKLWISITGTAARTIAWGASFEASTIALPTTTVTTARLDVGFIWNVATSKWRCIGTC